MKKKLLLIIGMFLFISNVSALTFNVDLTDIEDKGNNGTIGSIERIDVANKELDVLFQDIGDEVNFELTVSNTGDRAGTLRSINIISSNDKIVYTHNLPEGGLAINGNDTNKVLINAKVQAGATKGKTTSEIKLTYNYDEGSCPEGEILSDDESMCLCPEGKERNEMGICVVPEKKIECKDDEIYNETKKICEKKVVPAPDKTTPSNPKTMDNIVLITLLFFVSGLGIYAVLFKKLKTKKSKITAGVITGATVLTLSFTVLAGVFGLDNLLGAIVNPITKSKEIVITVNEDLDLIETWDGECSLDVSELTPDNIFEGGSGTENDPYQIKTAEQLSCFAKSVNNGTTYQGQFIKQTKNIKLNDDLEGQVAAGDLSNAHIWIPAGNTAFGSTIGINPYGDNYFAGTYDGNNKIIAGLYLSDGTLNVTTTDDRNFNGLFGTAMNATFKNIVLSEVYADTTTNSGSLLGFGYENIIIENVTTYGRADYGHNYSGGIAGVFKGSYLKLEDVENNIDIPNTVGASGIIHYLSVTASSDDEDNFIVRNTVNNGDIAFKGSIAGGIFGRVDGLANILIENSGNNGHIVTDGGSQYGGIVGTISGTRLIVNDSYNTGDWEIEYANNSAGLIGATGAITTINNCFNSGNIIDDRYPDAYESGSSYQYFAGILGTTSKKLTITNSYNTGDITGLIGYAAGIVSSASGDGSVVDHCYNTGNLTAYGYIGGIVGLFQGDVTNSYNKGNIHVFGGARSGGIAGWGAAWSRGLNIYNSYNEGDILVTSLSGQHGGLCAADCGIIKNSYNRGNITVTRYGFDIGGITGQSGTISNVYNSGTIEYLATGTPNGHLAGISATSSPSNSYNLGDVIVHQIGRYPNDLNMAGIASNGNGTNCVNAGDIILKVDSPYTGTVSGIYMGGISAVMSSTNSFNAGRVMIDDSALDTPVAEDGYSHRIYRGQISYGSGSGNLFNSDPNGYATGCLTVANPSSSCTIERSLTVGTYTDEDTPSVLSIINGDGAFNDELDEYGLPTLKAFNE